MKLLEVLSRPYPWKWAEEEQDLLVAYSKLDDGSRLRISVENDQKFGWIVSFHRNGEIDITGGGDQFRIFSTVLDVLSEFVRMVNPDKLYFTASKGEYGTELSRDRLYRRLCQTLASRYGYSLETDGDQKNTFFTLNRKDFSERLDETMSSPYPWRWTRLEDEFMEADAVLPDGSILGVSFVEEGTSGRWEAVFGRNESIDATGTGDQFRVFSTVSDVIWSFVATKSPIEIKFSAAKSENGRAIESRIKLYRRMCQLEAPKRGYSVKEKETNKKIWFIMTKKSIHLNESLTMSYPWEWTREGRLKMEAQFVMNNEDLVRVFMTNDGESNWSINFSRNCSFGKTGAGDQFHLFSTILKILDDFIRRFKPNTIKFSADKGDDGSDLSRTRLYLRLCKSLASRYGYTFDHESSFQRTKFVLTRNPNHFDE